MNKVVVDYCRIHIKKLEKESLFSQIWNPNQKDLLIETTPIFAVFLFEREEGFVSNLDNGRCECLLLRT